MKGIVSIILAALAILSATFNPAMAQTVADPCPGSKIAVVRTGPDAYTRVCADPATPEGIRIAARGAGHLLVADALYGQGPPPVFYGNGPDANAAYARTYMTTTAWDMQESVLAAVEATDLSERIQAVEERAHMQGQLMVLGTAIGGLEGSVQALTQELARTRQALAAAIAAGDEAQRLLLEAKASELAGQIEKSKQAAPAPESETKPAAPHTAANEPKSAGEARLRILSRIDTTP